MLAHCLEAAFLRKQHVLKADASLKCAGYALMKKNIPMQKLQAKQKIKALASFGPKTFSPTHLMVLNNSIETRAKCVAFFEIAQILGEVEKLEVS